MDPAELTTKSFRPRYAELPGRRAIGLYGPDEQLGGLNLLTPERVRSAAALVQTGEVFSLNAPVSYPTPHPHHRRKAPTHVVIRHSLGRDDYLDGLFPQSGSQWDGFLHVRDNENDCFYNGNTNESVGIEVWAERGIAGRGVLLDVARWREQAGRPIDWRLRDVVPVDDVVRCASDQGVSIDAGTILVFRFGWETGWLTASWEQRSEVASDFASPGLEPSPAMVELLWDWGVAATAADNYALEAFPLEAYFMHVDLLTRAGIPIGEFWHIDALADACAARHRYEFLFTSAPLNVSGGIGSTANALAIL